MTLCGSFKGENGKSGRMGAIEGEGIEFGILGGDLTDDGVSGGGNVL